MKVRSTRPPQPAWLRRWAAGGGIEVELIGGEDGVSPGQACVFYDAPDGQARVLGGGFIQNVADPPGPGRWGRAGGNQPAVRSGLSACSESGIKKIFYDKAT